MSNSLIEITAIEIKELAVIEPKQASEKFELIAKTMSDDQLAEVIENIDIVRYALFDETGESMQILLDDVCGRDNKDQRRRLMQVLIEGVFLTFNFD